MNVTFENDILEFHTPSSGDVKYAYFEYNNECLVFTTYYEDLGNVIRNHKSFSDFVRYDLTETSSSRQLFLGNSCASKTNKVYYTKENFSSINNAYKANNLKKLDKIINKSELLYQSK